MFRQVVRKLAAVQPRSCGVIATRNMTHYPINEDLFGTTEDQRQVCKHSIANEFIIIHGLSLQLRQTVFDFFQKELAPFAQEIDKTNEFK